MNDIPVLYILMRNDLPSMNPGKAMAQASHASDAFRNKVYEYFNTNSLSNNIENSYFDLVKEWYSQTSQGFGTVLVLSVNYSELCDTISNANSNYFICDIINDPSYPIIVGNDVAELISNRNDTLERKQIDKNNTIIFISNDTCGFIFGYKNDVYDYVKNFPLYQ